jgi:hypothetical protein
MRCDGVRPVGINVDNLAASFAILVSCLDGALPPGTLRFCLWIIISLGAWSSRHKRRLSFPPSLSGRSLTPVGLLCIEDPEAQASRYTHLPANGRISPQDTKHLGKGGILVDVTQQRAVGVELGQDPLHVYMRLLEELDFGSLESAWAVRCLRKLLTSWNPAQRSNAHVDPKLSDGRASTRDVAGSPCDPFEHFVFALRVSFAGVGVAFTGNCR